MTSADLASLRADLIEAEGDKPFPYDDATGQPLKRGDTLKGFLTVGVGFNLTSRPLSPRVRGLLLDECIDEAWVDLLTHFPWVAGLDPVRQRAVTEIRFALGAGTFRQFGQMIAALDRHDYEQAARQLLQSKAANQWQPSRTNRLVRMLRTGA